MDLDDDLALRLAPENFQDLMDLYEIDPEGNTS